MIYYGLVCIKLETFLFHLAVYVHIHTHIKCAVCLSELNILAHADLIVESKECKKFMAYLLHIFF